MFKIYPIQNKNEQEKYAEMCNTVIRPNHFAYAMVDIESGNLMGFSQFEIGSEYGIITDIKPYGELNDFEAMFILARQTMNFIDLCGAHKAMATEDSANEKLLHLAGFRRNSDGKFIVDMNGMFDGKCDGHKVELK